MGLAGCEELLLGKVEFTRLRPLLVFLFKKFALASHDGIKRLHVGLYYGQLFSLRHGREDGDGACE